MSIKLMYITNSKEIALIVEKAGVDRIFVDMEYIGKADRQGGMDTVQSHHTVEDVKALRGVIKSAELLVRVNPIHAATEGYCSSEEEINNVIACGADIVMLPYFKTAKEVSEFISYVGGRARTMLLVETPEAVEHIDEILELDGVDEVFIGLNDLSLGYGKKFMFELLSDGTVDALVEKFREKGISYGFGGLASLNGGLVPGSMVLKEHYRLGSSCVILSRSFCNTNKITDLNVITETFYAGIDEIRKYEMTCNGKEDLEINRVRIKEAIELVARSIK